MMEVGVLFARQLREWAQHCEHRAWPVRGKRTRCAHRATYTLSWRERTSNGQLIAHHRYLCNEHTWHAAENFVAGENNENKNDQVNQA